MFNPFDKEARIQRLREKAERARQTREIMRNPMIAEALDYLETTVVDAMKALKPTDIEGRDACWRELRAVARFKQRLEDVMRSGEIAQREINQLDR